MKALVHSIVLMKEDRNFFCHAPFNNLFFGNRGTVMACCANKTHVLGSFPEQSIKEIWQGEKANELRLAVQKGDYTKGCMGCGILYQNGNYSSMPSTAYDNHPTGNTDWPKRFEFEITNTCNLECVMCTGEYSSSIRERRERKPPLYDPYDGKFIEQLKPFIPHLYSARFIGGEPFLIPRYFDIWEMMMEMNPAIQIFIQTNGTILNTRVKRLLEKLQVSISVSIDSLQPETYELIRVNGNLPQTLGNITFLSNYCREKQTQFSLSFCPMVNNWKEIPDMISFANKHNATVFYNTVYYPAHLSLKNLPKENLLEVVEFLEASIPAAGNELEIQNLKTYNDQIREIKAFYRNANVKDYSKNSSVTFDGYLLRMHQYVYAKPELTEKEKKAKYELIESKLYEFMRVATAENLFLETVRGLNALAEDIVYQNIPVMEDASVVFKEFKERILATLK